MLVVLADSSPKLTDWLTALGGVGAFLATATLAVVAFIQMRKLDWQARSQAASTSDQIAAMREQVDVLRETSAAERAVVERQVEAAVEQGRSIRDAARAELQPVVFAHALPVKYGPDDDYSIAEGQIAFAYFIANEGLGSRSTSGMVSRSTATTSSSARGCRRGFSAPASRSRSATRRPAASSGEPLSRSSGDGIR